MGKRSGDLFRAQFKPEYCDQLTEHIASGGTLKSFSKLTPYSYPTVHRWLQNHPEFQQAKLIGEQRRGIKPRLVDPNEIPNLVLGSVKSF